MKLRHPMALAVLLALTAASPLPCLATTQSGGVPAKASTAAKSSPQDDPFANVYILMSRATYLAGLQAIASNPVARRDSIGHPLVVARIRAHQLPDLSRFIHENQKRCGGFFAFDSLAEADAFLRSDRSAQALLASALPAYTIDNQATVNPWLPQVSEAKLRGTITHLSTAYPNRYYSTSNGLAAANWIRDNWLALAAGRSDASAEMFTACNNCGGQPSVILTIQGTDLASEVLVLGGHLDSISNSGSGEAMNAPGADDDASGIASLTEVLRVAMAGNWKPRRTVKFMAYAAEEVGLRGSNAIAKAFRSQGVNVVGVLQLDMTDYRAGSPYDMQLITDYSNPTLQAFVTDLFDTYLAPLGMVRGTYTCGYGCSDHASWTSAGFPSAMMYEGGDFPYLHTVNDNLGQLGNTAQPSVALTKLGLAFLGELGKSGGAVVPPSSVLANGVPVTGLSAPAGTSLAYTFQVPANAQGLKFEMLGGTGNADLYVRFGSAPTDTLYDCRPFRVNNTETCTIAAVQAGTYYVTVKARKAFSGVQLTARYTTAGGGGGAGQQLYTSNIPLDLGDVATTNSPITVGGRSGNAAVNTAVSVNITHPRRGDLRIKLVAPDGTLYVLKASNTRDSAANVIETYSVNLSAEALDGIWQLRVMDVAAGNVGRLNSWSINF